MHHFGVTTFPCFAVVTNITNYSSLAAYLQSLNYPKRITRNGLILLSSKQGDMTAQQLISELSNTLETHGPLIIATKSERSDRETEREIRDSQDRDYEESLRRDKDKDKIKREEEAKKKDRKKKDK